MSNDSNDGAATDQDNTEHSRWCWDCYKYIHCTWCCIWNDYTDTTRLIHLYDHLFPSSPA